METFRERVPAPGENELDALAWLIQRARAIRGASIGPRRWKAAEIARSWAAWDAEAERLAEDMEHEYGPRSGS